MYPRAVLTAFIALAGCGTRIPDIHEFYDPQTAEAMIETIQYQAQCEIQKSVQYLMLDDIDAVDAAWRIYKYVRKPELSWLNEWAAQVTLVITVDEKGGFNPGISITPPLAPAVSTFSSNKTTVTTQQSFSLGLGAGLATDGTRKDTLSWLVDFVKFTDRAELEKVRAERDAAYAAAANAGSSKVQMPCGHKGSAFVDSDLAIREWLYAATLPANVHRAGVPDFAPELQAEAKASKKDVIAHEITFVVTYSGNVTPSWKLLRVSINQGGSSFLSAQRSRTQDLVISMGPKAPDGSVSTAAQNATLAAQIGQAVANAIRATQ